MLPFLPYTRQTIDEEDRAAVAAALRGDVITRGPCVKQFEEALAKKCGAKWAVAFPNASIALYAAYCAVDTGPFDKVAVPAITFATTLSGALLRSATPYFIDVDPLTGLADSQSLKQFAQLPRSRGKLIATAVHYAGQALDMDDFGQECDVVIEDAAHALGSFYANGQPVGCCYASDMTVFSFHPAKNITTGEGGAITTNSDKHYQRLLRWRNSGIERQEGLFASREGPWSYDVLELSLNYNVTEMQAALGLSQLRKLERFGEKKRALLQRYRHQLSDLESLSLLPSERDAYTHYHLCPAFIDFGKLRLSRATLMEELARAGIGTQVHYIPLYRHSAFKTKPLSQNLPCPGSEDFYAKELSLPLFPSMQEADVDRVCQQLKRVLLKR